MVVIRISPFPRKCSILLEKEIVIKMIFILSSSNALNLDKSTFSLHVKELYNLNNDWPRPGGSVVSVSDS